MPRDIGSGGTPVQYMGSGCNTIRHGSHRLVNRRAGSQSSADASGPASGAGSGLVGDHGGVEPQPRRISRARRMEH